MQRPAAVSILGILNIVFGVLALFDVFNQFNLLAPQSAADEPKNSIAGIMHANPNYFLLVKCTMVLSLLGFVLLLIAGIGLLRLGEWARKLSIGYGLFAILAQVGLVAGAFLFVSRPAFAMAAKIDGSPAPSAVIPLVTAIMGGVFGLIYPVVLIVYMTRPKIAAAFLPPEQPPTLRADQL